MGTNWTMTLLALTMFGHASPYSAAADGFMKANLVTEAHPPGCHELIMPAECKAYLTALAAHPEGSGERMRLIAEHRELIREREAACGGPRRNAAYVYRPLRQAVREY